MQKFVICGNTEEKAVDRSDEPGGPVLDEAKNRREDGADRLGIVER